MANCLLTHPLHITLLPICTQCNISLPSTPWIHLHSVSLVCYIIVTITNTSWHFFTDNFKHRFTLHSINQNLTIRFWPGRPSSYFIMKWSRRFHYNITAICGHITIMIALRKRRRRRWRRRRRRWRRVYSWMVVLSERLGMCLCMRNNWVSVCLCMRNSWFSSSLSRRARSEAVK